MASPVTIGWKERVCLPEWGITNIEAKADTGARSSAIDVKHLEFLDEETVQFEVALSRNDRSNTVPVIAKLKRHTRVRSSNGHMSERVVVETEMLLGTISKPIEVSLICRKRMQCRMLIGRSALQDDFLINSRESYLVSTPQRKKKKKKRNTQEPAPPDHNSPPLT